MCSVYSVHIRQISRHLCIRSICVSGDSVCVCVCVVCMCCVCTICVHVRDSCVFCVQCAYKVNPKAPLYIPNKEHLCKWGQLCV